MLDELFQLSQTFQQLRNRTFRRYFLQDHSLNNHFSIILGQRGVGKTTVMIQHLLDQNAGDRFSRKSLYLQSDHFLVARLSLYEIADEFYKMGGKLICFDEIHKYRDWSMELKSITDTFPDLRIVASGSSALEIGKGSHDLSRRALVYKMYGLSFREYITMTTGIDLDRLSLETLLSEHQHATDGIITRIEKGGEKILALFGKYLATGFYPYFQEYADSAQFYLTLEQNIHTTLEADLPAIYSSLNGASIAKIKRLLAVISTLVPYTPDLKQLKTLLEIGDERTLKTYLKYLEDAGIILTVAKSGKGLRPLEKPAKIYLNNPNLYHALASTPNRGAIRETFFLNMLRVGHQVSVPERGDFLVDETLTFEVGGKNKKFNQIQGVEQAWLVLDNLEIGTEKRIPLWLFGFLY